MASPRHNELQRDKTDEGLSQERAKTDDELLKRSDGYEEAADTVVETARKRADEVVRVARARADETLRRSGADSDDLRLVAEQRREEDDLLGQERTTADATLTDERAARRRALTALLAAERANTDEHLGRERELADAAIGARDEFLALSSHDLRNMLGGIALTATSLNNIRCDETTHQAIVRDTQRIRRYVSRMERLVGDLIDVVSIEAGHLAVRPERHDAVELLRETMDVFQPLASAKGIWIGTDVKPGSLLARYDYGRILQVLANLVGNALKFTPDGGRIHVLVERVEGQVRFGVADTGPGIPPEKLGVIFDRFWQLAEKTTRSGLGLGLYISKCIVEAHGGRIWAESRVGEGSTFFFTLPAAEASSSRSPRERDGYRSSGRGAEG